MSGAPALGKYLVRGDHHDPLALRGGRSPDRLRREDVDLPRHTGGDGAGERALFLTTPSVPFLKEADHGVAIVCADRELERPDVTCIHDMDDLVAVRGMDRAPPTDALEGPAGGSRPDELLGETGARADHQDSMQHRSPGAASTRTPLSACGSREPTGQVPAG